MTDAQHLDEIREVLERIARSLDRIARALDAAAYQKADR